MKEIEAQIATIKKKLHGKAPKYKTETLQEIQTVNADVTVLLFFVRSSIIVFANSVESHLFIDQ